ncbi:MAG: PhoH-like ATPase [Flavobacteriales bacterium]|jgi:PhoH-like ATPase
MAKSKNSTKKIFVLDTSVILHDHNSINNFEEHDVAIPITVLEELDNFKIGNETKNFACREFIRTLDALSENQSLVNWVPLNGSDKKGKFKIVMNNVTTGLDAEEIYGKNKNDHKIINAALTLKELEPDRKVILVSKDINLRLKAKALDLTAEDYTTGKIKTSVTNKLGPQTIEDVPAEIIQELYKNNFTEEVDFLGDRLMNNGYYILKTDKNSILGFYNPFKRQLERVEKEYVYGIKPKNAEQTFALNALLNPNIKLVTLQGVAGTGKTLLALASALEQHNLYNQIVLARPIVPLSNKDIGFLPGSAEDKVNPYMQPLFDNLSFIKSQFSGTDKKGKKIAELEAEGRFKITPLAFIRGRSLSNVIFIVDEAQNLTPHEVKTIITRAGENTKIIFTGDIHQIDTPYLDDMSNGMSYIIDKLKGQELYAHIRLEKGERSELANLANDLL